MHFCREDFFKRTCIIVVIVLRFDINEITTCARSVQSNIYTHINLIWVFSRILISFTTFRFALLLISTFLSITQWNQVDFNRNWHGACVYLIFFFFILLLLLLACKIDCSFPLSSAFLSSSSFRSVSSSFFFKSNGFCRDS